MSRYGNFHGDDGQTDWQTDDRQTDKPITSPLRIVGTVNGCGHNSQLKYTIYDACGPCHSILSILEPVFCQLRQIRWTFESLRYLDVKIWRFRGDNDDRQTDRQTDYFTPAHARGIIITGLCIITTEYSAGSVSNCHACPSLYYWSDMHDAE